MVLSMATIGIIAGSGQFPFLVAQGARQRGFSVAIVGFEGNTDPALQGSCDAFTLIALGQVGALIKFLKKHKATQVCMAGAISKPKALDVKPDLRAAKLLFKLAGKHGDDAILRVLAEELKSEGIEVVRPEVLVPSLIDSPSGVLAGPDPSPELWADIAFGYEKAKVLGACDIGQCVAVHRGVVVAVEAIEGTDAAIERAGSLSKEKMTLVKVLKPHQDERLDRPSIGSRTIDLLAQNNFTCLAFEAGKTLFFDKDESFAKANKHGISVVGLPDDPADFFASKGGAGK